MIGSLPEGRGQGNIRSLMRAILNDYRNRGIEMAVLIPYSFRFYRKFGFELVARDRTWTADISQFAGFLCDFRIRQVKSQEDVMSLREMYGQFIRYMCPVRIGAEAEGMRLCAERKRLCGSVRSAEEHSVMSTSSTTAGVRL